MTMRVEVMKEIECGFVNGNKWKFIKEQGKEAKTWIEGNECP